MRLVPRGALRLALPVLLAAVSFVLGVAFGVGPRPPKPSEEPAETVVVLARGLSTGAVLTPEDLAERKVLAGLGRRDAITPRSLPLVVGHPLSRDLEQGAMLGWDDVDARRASPPLENERQVAVGLDVGDAVAPGDHLDLIALVKRPEPAVTTLVQNAIVKRVDPSTRGGDFRQVWLVVRAADAERLTLADARATLTATLRHPDDVGHIEPGLRTSVEPEVRPGHGHHGCRLQVLRIVRSGQPVHVP